MRAGKICKKRNTKSPFSPRDQEPENWCALATKSAWHCTPTSRLTSPSKKSACRESVQGSTLKIQKLTGSLLMQEHATTPSTSASYEGEVLSQTQKSIILREKSYEDDVLIKVVLNESGSIENVVQEVFSGPHDNRELSARPAQEDLNLVTDRCESLPSLSHDSVSKTLEEIELPRMGSQTGNSNEKLMTIVPATHTAVSPAPVLAHIPSSETCGQRFLETLKKKDKSDPLLELLDAPKLFNGRIWNFVNYTAEEIHSWDTDAPVRQHPRLHTKFKHTHPNWVPFHKNKGDDNPNQLNCSDQGSLNGTGASPPNTGDALTSLPRDCSQIKNTWCCNNKVQKM